MPIPSPRSSATSTSVTASTGVASAMMIEVAYCDQTNSGSRRQVMPGARSSCTVTMMLIAVKIDENPAMNTATTTLITCPLENIEL